MKTLQRCLLVLMLAAPIGALSQGVSGIITEKSTGLPLPGVNVIIKGTATGSTSDFEGNYFIAASNGDVLIFSYIGYKTMEVTVTSNTLNIALEEDTEVLDEVIVIGYGTTTKRDATGSVELVTADELNKGAITTVDQMLNGRSAGVRIVNSGGQPDSAPNIRIRGGASLNANNSPLIIIDNIPISINNPAGQSNPLALVNPNDIESFSILKDASATAIYGSRASNGVIIITTKKGSSGKPRFNFSSNIQVGTLTDKLDVLSSDEYVDFINQFFPSETNLLGVDGVVYDTDWQDVIYRTSITTDNNFSVNGNLFGNVPFRGSVGHTSIEGILRESSLERYNLSVSATPSFFDDHLKVSINAKGIITKKDQPDEGAIGSALGLNPTLPIFDPTGAQPFGGFYQTTDPQSSFLRTVGPTNALAQLQQRKRDEDANRFLGNIQFEYKLHAIPELKAILNLALDYSESDINERFLDNAILAYNNFEDNPQFNPGERYREEQVRQDRTMDAYLSYTKYFNESFITRVDAQGGYSYQNFRNSGVQFPTIPDGNGNQIPGTVFNYFNEMNIQSFFGRVNLDFKDKYLFTATFRTDGSSLFSEDNRWGYFPSAALAWKIKDENFLKDSNTVTDLKIRVGWGITGQQDISGSVGFYPYIPLYLVGDPTVQYSFDGFFIRTAAALAFNSNLTWENTATTNFGVDFNLWNGLLEGNVDYYFRKTTDLLSNVPQSEGSLRNFFVDNVGETESEGVEVSLNLTPISNDKVTVSFNGNISFNETYITDLNNVTQITRGDTGVGRGTGVNIGTFKVGQLARTFWLYEQIYDANGNPIQDSFVDQDGNGIINDDDRIFIPVDPKWTYGFGTNINYKNFDFTANFRGQLGGNIFNANLLNRGNIGPGAVIPANGVGFINNVLDLYDGTNYNGFTNLVSDQQALSDFYVSDGSFLRLDNITLGYNFMGLFDNKLQVRMYASVNNVFVISDYDGLDPENFNGIEQSPYARPRTYTFGMNFDF
ncbi:TonB-dependent receptor [Ascidiimonas aurantiaca]|uniref:SusC/RagA family TonB-linked outer membrane protein n=1 Tax=Ascidiimonas aurantiaca TaxID=1685432 RepID=UPI0030ED35A1